MSKQIRQLDLSKKALKELDRRIGLTKDRSTADRLRVIKFKAYGLTHEDIAKLLGIGINQVTEYLKRYQQGGIEAVCHRYYKGSKPLLTFSEINQLKIELLTTISNTVAQVIVWVEKKFFKYNYSFSFRY